MQKNVKIIATIGPKSNNPEILSRLKDRGVDFFRINLSHTDEDEIEEKVKNLLGYDVPVILDTEGNQIRSGNRKEIEYKEGEEITLHGKEVECDSKNLFLNPPEIMGNFREGDLISLGFNHSLIGVIDVSQINTERKIKCRVIIGGIVGGRKAVQVHSDTFVMPPFSKKDFRAMEIAKKYEINHFTLSFMESAESVRQFRSLYPWAVLYSKIESKKGLDNFIEIAEESDGILIDRGDLSNQVPVERIPLIQKHIIRKVKEMGKEIFVATNTLEEMASSLKPNRSEVNDMINTILDGVTGIALTKETAVGNYPVETVNMLKNLISQLEFVGRAPGNNLIEKIENSNYSKSQRVPSLLVEPHGGVLVNRISKKRLNENLLPKKIIEIDEDVLMDAEQIAIGSFSPLKGFMNEKDFNSVVERMRLSNGIVWPIPIVLRVNEETRKSIKAGDEVSLRFRNDKKIYAVIKIDDIYKPNKNISAEKIYRTLDNNHPGVKKFLEGDDYFVGGEITLLRRRSSPNKVYELTPEQTRKIFSDRGWSKVLGFHTRNAIHRGHEFVQLEGLKRSMCDGLLVHPVIGKKKEGDFESEAIIKTYEKMIEKFYPQSRVLFSTLATFSRYAGPREAIFTALVRKNFGCSHFVVGRDHTGVGSFYSPTASHEIFNKFTYNELGINPVIFDKVFYSSIKNGYVHEPDFPNHPEKEKMHISGTEARKMLESGVSPPDWFMRKEISQVILDMVKSGKSVFVKGQEKTTNQIISYNQIPSSKKANENKNKGEKEKARVLWLTGLSGSGKTAIAKSLSNIFKEKGKKHCIIDGDDVRAKINKNLGFTPEDIKENNRIITEMCKENLGKYDYILVPVISPFRESRENARKQIGNDFIEIFVDCPYNECKKRDTKGLYAKAESGKINNFIGLHVPYEHPKNPEIRVETSKQSLLESTNKILEFIKF